MQSKCCSGEERDERYVVGDAFCHGVAGASSWLAEEVCEVYKSSAVHVRRIYCGEG